MHRSLLRCPPLSRSPLIDVPANVSRRSARGPSRRYFGPPAGGSKRQPAMSRRPRRQFYPNVNLTAFIGLASIGLNQLINTGSSQWGVGPAIHLPDLRRRQASARACAARTRRSRHRRRGPITAPSSRRSTMWRTSSASLRSIEKQQRERDAEPCRGGIGNTTWRSSDFAPALSTYLTVLTTETTVLNERRQDADLKARALDVRIALIRALGGGYVAEPEMRTAAARADSQVPDNCKDSRRTTWQQTKIPILPRTLKRARRRANPKRRKALTAVAALVVAGGIGYGAYWWLVLNHFETTDNAYVQGNVVQITPAGRWHRDRDQRRRHRSREGRRGSW